MMVAPRNDDFPSFISHNEARNSGKPPFRFEMGFSHAEWNSRQILDAAATKVLSLPLYRPAPGKGLRNCEFIHFSINHQWSASNRGATNSTFCSDWLSILVLRCTTRTNSWVNRLWNRCSRTMPSKKWYVETGNCPSLVWNRTNTKRHILHRRWLEQM